MDRYESVNGNMIKTDLVFCIQCTDKLSGQRGTFAYHKDIPFCARSPVFQDSEQFYNWLKARDLFTGQLADFAIYEID